MGWTFAGLDPALAIRNRAPNRLRASPSAIGPRAEFATDTNSTPGIAIVRV